MYNGIINVYKEKGYTSHDVVAVLRGVLKQKKIGHTGTLDPDATGVLPICLGKGTKVAGMLTDNDKAYRATFILGQETDTQDHTGKVINEMPWNVNEAQVLAAINAFTGAIEQLPPMYSAIKIDGQKLYDLAREGITVSRKTRSVVIHAIDHIEVRLPVISMTVRCSKGTYIRTLCRDISEYLGTCGHMTSLERIQSGPFTLDTAMTIEKVKELVDSGDLRTFMTTVDSLFKSYKEVVIQSDYYKLLDNGNKMPLESYVSPVDMVDGERYNVYNEERDYMGIYEWNGRRRELVPIKFFCIRQREDNL